jgi:hypothetical protein
VITFWEWLDENQIYYWTTNAELNPGDIVKAGQYLQKEYNEWVQAFDKLLEELRKKEFSQLPSRNNAIFLSDPEFIKNWNY